MASYFLPMSTFGTILDLRESHEGSLTLAVLGSLSVLYVLMGAMCVLSPPSCGPLTMYGLRPS